MCVLWTSARKTSTLKGSRRENPSNRRCTESFISYSVHVCYIFYLLPETFTVDASLTLHNSGSSDWPPRDPVLNFCSPHPYLVSQVLFAFCVQKAYHTHTPFPFCSHSLGFWFIWQNVEYFVSKFHDLLHHSCGSLSFLYSHSRNPALDRLKPISVLYLVRGQLCEMIPTVIDYRGGQSWTNPQNFCSTLWDFSAFHTFPSQTCPTKIFTLVFYYLLSFPKPKYSCHLQAM